MSEASRGTILVPRHRTSARGARSLSANGVEARAQTVWADRRTSDTSSPRIPYTTQHMVRGVRGVESMFPCAPRRSQVRRADAASPPSEGRRASSVSSGRGEGKQVVRTPPWRMARTASYGRLVRARSSTRTSTTHAADIPTNESSSRRQGATAFVEAETWSVAATALLDPIAHA